MDNGDGELLVRLLAWLVVSIKKLFANKEEPSSTALDDANTSVKPSATELNQTKSIDTRDPFLKTRARATQVGAIAGLVGVVVGLLVLQRKIASKKTG